MTLVHWKIQCNRRSNKPNGVPAGDPNVAVIGTSWGGNRSPVAIDNVEFTNICHYIGKAANKNALLACWKRK